MSFNKLVLKHFTNAPNENKKLPQFKCNYCTYTCAVHSTRMANHLCIDCKGCPDSVKVIISQSTGDQKKTNVSSLKRKRSRSLDLENTESDAIMGNKDKTTRYNENDGSFINIDPKRNKISFYLDNLSDVDQKTAKKLLAKAIYTSALPLSFVENEFFVQFCKFLRPKFSVPNRNDMSNRLLTDTVKEVQDQVDDKIKNSNSLAIQCDAYSNIKNEGLNNFIITTPSPVFYKSVPTKTKTQDSDYLVDIVSEVIDEVGQEKVLGIVTDNAAYCKKAWRILENKYQVFPYGCVSHILNLLVMDVVEKPTVTEIVKTSKAIIKEIKRSHILSALFAEIQKSVANDEEQVLTTLKLPGRTRWGSHFICLKSFYDNRFNLKKLTISRKAEGMNQSSKSLICDDEFWTKISKLLLLLEPIVAALFKLESDNPLPSQVPEIFIQIESHLKKQLNDTCLSLLPRAEATDILTCCEKRSKMALTPVHYASNMLDPKFKGINLTSSQLSEGRQAIYKIADRLKIDPNQLTVELVEFNAGTGLWSDEFVRRSVFLVSSLEWWKGACNSSSLSKIAIALLELPCTSAATERSFSTYGWIHNSKRNRLTIQRASQLTYVAHNLTLLNPTKKNKTKKGKLFTNDHESSGSDDSEEEIEKVDTFNKTMLKLTLLNKQLQIIQN